MCVEITDMKLKKKIAIVVGIVLLLAAVVGFTIHKSRFLYGAFFNALLAFLLIAAAVFFFVIVPVNVLMARRRTEPPVDPATRDCPECLSSIPKAARRCAFCTAEIGVAA